MSFYGYLRGNSIDEEISKIERDKISSVEIIIHLADLPYNLYEIHVSRHRKEYFFPDRITHNQMFRFSYMIALDISITLANKLKSKKIIAKIGGQNPREAIKKMREYSRRIRN